MLELDPFSTLETSGFFKEKKELSSFTPHVYLIASKTFKKHPGNFIYPASFV